MNKEKTSQPSPKREQLTQVALTAVQTSGLKGLSFRTLADEVGVKSSSVHYHFPEKADLAYNLIQRYSEAFAQRLREIADDQTLSLTAKIDLFIDVFCATADAKKMCLCGMMAAELDHLDDKSKELLEQYFENTEHWLRQLLAQSMNAAQSTMNADTLARCLMSGLEGALLLDRVDGGTERLEAQRRLAHQLISP